MEFLQYGSSLFGFCCFFWFCRILKILILFFSVYFWLFLLLMPMFPSAVLTFFCTLSSYQKGGRSVNLSQLFTWKMFFLFNICFSPCQQNKSFNYFYCLMQSVSRNCQQFCHGVNVVNFFFFLNYCKKMEYIDKLFWLNDGPYSSNTYPKYLIATNSCVGNT